MSRMDALFERLREVLREELRAAWTPPRALTYEIAARELSISTRQVRRLVASGQIATCVIGKRPMIPRTEIERMVRVSTPPRRPRPGRPRAETYSPADEAAKSRALRAAKRRS